MRSESMQNVLADLDEEPSLGGSDVPAETFEVARFGQCASPECYRLAE